MKTISLSLQGGGSHGAFTWSVLDRRRDALIERDKPVTLKEAAYAVMEEAYLAASANGTLPANPRQTARGPILEVTGKESLDSQHFTQTLLVDYIEETGVDWDIVWDDRGHAEGGPGLASRRCRGFLRRSGAGFGLPRMLAERRRTWADRGTKGSGSRGGLARRAASAWVRLSSIAAIITTRTDKGAAAKGGDSRHWPRP